MVNTDERCRMSTAEPIGPVEFTSQETGEQERPGNLLECYVMAADLQCQRFKNWVCTGQPQPMRT